MDNILTFNGSTFGLPPNGTGALTEIAVGSATAVWGINTAGEVYQYNSPGLPPGFQQPDKSARLQSISVGSATAVWGINTSGEVYQYIISAKQFQQPDKSARFRSIAVGSATAVWGINTAGEVYQYNSPGLPPGFQQPDKSARLQSISVGSATAVWGINTSGEVYQYNSPGLPPGFQQPDKSARLQSISVGSDDKPWGINSSSEIYLYNGKVFVPVSFPGAELQELNRREPTTIAAGSATAAWVLDQTGTPWGFGYPLFAFKEFSASLTQIAVGSDRTTWGLEPQPAPPPH